MESNFKPAKAVLKKFGYREISSEELSIVDSLDSKYSENRLQPVMDATKNIVFELFLMSVELTVLVPILKFAKKEGYSIEDALRARRRTKGGVQEAVDLLEKHAHKSFASKRRKLQDDIESMASLRDDYPTLKGNGKEDVSRDGREENENAEDALQRHQQNREKFVTRAGPSSVKYPPGNGIEAGLKSNEIQQYRLGAMDVSGHGANESVLGELANSTARDGYGGDAKWPVGVGYNMVVNDFDDADLYGHSGSGMRFDHDTAPKVNQPKDDCGALPPFSTTVVTPKVTYTQKALQPEKIDVPSENFATMDAFLNMVKSTDGHTHQDQIYGKLWNCTTSAVLPPYNPVDEPPPPYNETRDSDGYVFVENPERNIDKKMVMERPVPSKPKTQEPYHYPGQAKSTDPSVNLSFCNKGFQHCSTSGYGDRNRAYLGDVAKDDLSAVNAQMQCCLKIQHSSLPYEPSTTRRVDLRKDVSDRSASAVSGQRDSISSVLDGSAMTTFPDVTRDMSKQTSSRNRGTYSTLPDQKPATCSRENISDADPTNLSRTRSSDPIVKQSTGRSLVSTRSSAFPSNAVSSVSNADFRYSAPGSVHGNPPLASTSSAERSSGFNSSSKIDPSYSSGTNQATATEKKLFDSKSLHLGGNITKHFPQFDASLSAATALTVNIPPADTRKKESFAEKSTRVTEEPKMYNLRSSSSNPVREGTVCDHCQLEGGASICRDCFKISCNDCQEIFLTDLCPKVTKEGIKGPHIFIRLSSKRTSKSKLTGQSSRSSEQAPAGTPSSDDQPDGTGMEEWSCERCTMLNPPNNTVCSACATTRGLEEPTPSKAGSAVCGECTYHNAEGAKVCEMCHKTLDRSETYI